MLRLADHFFTVLHLLIIGFNLFGWIWPVTKRAHLLSIFITAGCWFILGIWFGWGYCPITDWQWNVKSKLGEKGIPASFIEYFAEKITGSSFDSKLVDMATLIGFLIVATISVYVNGFNTRGKKKGF